jgi:hypothetical protein
MKKSIVTSFKIFVIKDNSVVLLYFYFILFLYLIKYQIVS